MGCDLHGFVERKNEMGQWEYAPGFHPFDWRSYRLYGWLAGVRNYSAVTPLSKPRGLPGDASASLKEKYNDDDDYHSASWVSLEELLEFDYDAMVEDRRVSTPHTGNATCAPGEGETMTYREFLGKNFFEELGKLKEIGTCRVVFWFDS